MKRKILATSRVTRNFQVTIPLPVRTQFGIGEGDTVVFIDEDGKLVLAKSTIG